MLIRILILFCFIFYYYSLFYCTLIDSSAVYVVNPRDMFEYICFAVAQKDCACIVSTYNQLRKLWENKDKQLYNHKEQQNSTAKHQQQIQDGMIYHRACSRHSTASSGL